MRSLRVKHSVLAKKYRANIKEIRSSAVRREAELRSTQRELRQAKEKILRISAASVATTPIQEDRRATPQPPKTATDYPPNNNNNRRERRRPTLFMEEFPKFGTMDPRNNNNNAAVATSAPAIVAQVEEEGGGEPENANEEEEDHHREKNNTERAKRHRRFVDFVAVQGELDAAAAENRFLRDELTALRQLFGVVAGRDEDFSGNAPVMGARRAARRALAFNNGDDAYFDERLAPAPPAATTALSVLMSGGGYVAPATTADPMRPIPVVIPPAPAPPRPLTPPTPDRGGEEDNDHDHGHGDGGWPGHHLLLGGLDLFSSSVVEGLFSSDDE
jgi:hypothetical protein